MKKAITLVLSLLLTTVVIAGCADADVVLKYSPDSLDRLTKAFPSLVNDNTSKDHYYTITVDGTATLKISHDYNATGPDDIVMETSLKPFSDAGLDINKLGEGYKVSGDKLQLTADYGKGSGEQKSIVNSMFESVKYDRKVLTYHQDLDHYGIKLTRGKFEWAKDYTKNDKDIVFVIAAKPLSDIGVNVQNIQGWVFKTMKDTDGSDVDVLLKPYELK